MLPCSVLVVGLLYASQCSHTGLMCLILASAPPDGVLFSHFTNDKSEIETLTNIVNSTKVVDTSMNYNKNTERPLTDCFDSLSLSK